MEVGDATVQNAAAYAVVCAWKENVSKLKNALFLLGFFFGHSEYMHKMVKKQMESFRLLACSHRCF
jgi:hypothetical protein